MKLVNYLGTTKRLGAIVDDKIVDLNLAYATYLQDNKSEARPYALADAIVPASLQDFIVGGQKTLDEAKKTLDYAKKNLITFTGPAGEKAVWDAKDVKLLSTLPSLAAKLVCMGGNSGRIAAEKAGGKTRDGKPLSEHICRGFLAHSSCVIGPGDPVIYPPPCKALDFELECAAIIGMPGKDISQKDANKHIFGYTVANDISARDSRGMHGLGVTDRDIFQFVYLQKNWDTSKPMGPCILTADEAGDIYKHRMTMTVNGVVRQDAVIYDMIHNFENIIEFFGEDWTWKSGDVIWSGTVAGSPHGAPTSESPHMKVGDVMEAWVEGIGTLKNTVVAKK